MGIIASDMRRGMAIMFNGEPCRVLEFHHHTPGNLRAMVQAKLRKLRTGTQLEHRFRSTDTVEIAALETHELDFMYKAGETYHFMNAENYDQLEVDEETLGETAKWMSEGMRIIAEFYEGREELYPQLYPAGRYPPNTLLVVNGLVRPELLLEIDAIAYVPAISQRA